MAVTNLMKRTDLVGRQDELVRTNVRWLVQAMELLERIDDETYTRRPEAIPHTVGAHLRHILEFYECLLDGIAGAHIDYDNRRRDVTVERSRVVALARLRATADRLAAASELRCDPTLFVRIEDADGMLLRDHYLTSSAGRELSALSSHTVHHLAMIAVTLQCLGVAVDEELGVAPATLRYRSQLRQTQATAEAA